MKHGRSAGRERRVHLDRRREIGTAELIATRPRPPCFHLADVASVADILDALGENRGWICAAVTTSGRISVGDDVTVGEPITADPDDLANAIRDRYGLCPQTS